METTVGIISGTEPCAGIARFWSAEAGGGPPLMSPPATVEETASQAGIIILDAGPRRMPAILAALRPLIVAQTALVSTSPAVSLAMLRHWAGPGPALLRAVLALGGQPGEGVVALAAAPDTQVGTSERVKAALAWIGPVESVAEEALDAIAALVVGAPGFLCDALQGLEDGAAEDGLPRATARAFTHHTALATALLLRNHGGSPADLKDQVASPGGTTIAALAALEDVGVRGAYIRAVERAAAEVRRRRDAAVSGVVE